SCSIANGTGSQVCNANGSSYLTCTLNSCSTGYHANGNTCESDVISCTVANGSGTQTWNGASYDACILNSCNSGYYLDGNSCLFQNCIPDQASSCNIANGTG